MVECWAVLCVVLREVCVCVLTLFPFPVLLLTSEAAYTHTQLKATVAPHAVMRFSVSALCHPY